MKRPVVVGGGIEFDAADTTVGSRSRSTRCQPLN